jgi:N-methylhydantoinase B/oxoprolinase/acetone carboxylase alpha subunit
MIASARVGEKRLVELCREYGNEVIKQFIDEYIDYADEIIDSHL